MQKNTPTKSEAPYQLIMPEKLSTPILFAVPHSGRCYPDDMTEYSQLPPQKLRSSEDAYVDELYNFAPALGAPLLVANYARAYVDLNRSADEVDPDMFTGPRSNLSLKPRQTHRVNAGLGVIPKIVSHNMKIYAHRIPANTIEDRLNRIYYPYHKALQTSLELLRERFGFALLIDCHSMPSPDPVLGLKRPWPDIIIGDSWGNSANQSFTAKLETALRRKGFSARRNVPYAGGFVTTHYGQPEKGFHALQIELNRALYIDEPTIVKRPCFGDIKARLQTAICDFLPFISAKIVPSPRAAE